MIQIDTVTALLLYMGVFLFLCFGAWMIAHVKGRKKTSLPPLFELVSCEYCAFSYLVETGDQITTCPQCGSYNRPLA